MLNWEDFYYSFRMKRELTKQLEKQKNFIETQSAQLAKTPEIIRGFSRRHSNSGISLNDYTNLIEKKCMLESFKAQYVIDIINNAPSDVLGYGTLLSISTTPMSPFDFFHENGEPHLSFRIKIGTSKQRLSEFSESNLPFAIMPSGKLSFIMKPTDDGVPLELLDADEGLYSSDSRARHARKRFLHLSHTYSLIDGNGASDAWLAGFKSTETDRTASNNRHQVPKAPQPRSRKGGRRQQQQHQVRNSSSYNNNGNNNNNNVIACVNGTDINNGDDSIGAEDHVDSDARTPRLFFPPFNAAKDNGRCVFTGRSHVISAPFKRNAGRFEIALHEIEPVLYMFAQGNSGERRCLTWIIKDIMVVVPCAVLEKITRKWSEMSGSSNKVTHSPNNGQGTPADTPSVRGSDAEDSGSAHSHHLRLGE
eukprot:Opistho-2@58751